MKRVAATVLIILFAAASANARPTLPAVKVWLTTADQTQKLSLQPAQKAAGPASGTEAISIDTSRHFQKIHGFGAAMTDASAQLLSELPEGKRKALMAELFGRGPNGLGLSFTRLTVGASDFSTSDYSYDDTPGNLPDPELRYFSIVPAKKYVLPRVREALAINPDLLVMISPWSAPAWMKSTKSLIGGELAAQYYSAFASYLARTIESFGRQGVPVSMLTIQNEPNFEPDSYPGMRVDPKQRAAWHCYEGDVPAQSPVHDAYPDKDAWLTECSGGEWTPKFSEVLAWMTDKLIIGASNNWSRGTLLWNLALDPAHGPHTGGCSDCRGVVTIDPVTGAITRNVEYYVLGHASRFVLPGAFRVAAIKRSAEVEAAAFLNPDGSRIAILHRKSGCGPVMISVDGERYAVPLPDASVATLRWGRISRGK